MDPGTLAAGFARGLATAAGLLLLYAALFLYPDERRRLQNTMERWWVALDDARLRAGERRPLLIRRIATTARDGFGRLFGEPFSKRFFVVSGLLSMLSFGLAMSSIGDYGWAVPSGLLVFGVVTAFAVLQLGQPMDRLNAELRERLALEALDEGFFPRGPHRVSASRLSPGPGAERRHPRTLLGEHSFVGRPDPQAVTQWWEDPMNDLPGYVALGLMATSSTGLVLAEAQERGVGTTVFVLAAITAVACDMVSILITMGVLEKLSEAGTASKAAGWLLIDAAVAGAMLLVPLGLVLTVVERGGALGTYLVFVASSNVSTAAPSAVYLLLAAGLLLHRLVWPLVLRPFYNLVHAERLHRPKLLGTLGLGALLAAWPRVLEPVAPAVRRLLDLF